MEPLPALQKSQRPQPLRMSTERLDRADTVCWQIMQDLSQAVCSQLELAHMQQSTDLPSWACKSTAPHNPVGVGALVPTACKWTSDGMEKGAHSDYANSNQV